MKNSTTQLLVFSALVCLLSACEEEPPYINFNAPQSTKDSTYITPNIPTAEDKEVLIEDISGVSCKNCPDAAVIAKSIVAANPGRVNVITIYPNIPFGGLTNPLNKEDVKNKFDLRSDIGKNIVDFVTVPPSLPSGYIDRNKFSGNDWAIPRDNWSGYVNSELTLSSPVNIEIIHDYNPSSKKLTAKVKLTYTKGDSAANFLHVMLLQDSIVDAQEKADPNNGSTIYDSVYVHNHVLMDMLTAHTGDLLNSSSARNLVPGRVFEITYEKTLDTRSAIAGATLPAVPWNPDHMKILVIVTKGPEIKSILQSKEIDLK